ncbi:MAG: tetratricopeptide repeat protein [Lachnospiraceae bacterium]|nr:tetratricopeptide repeat protein [Lachnospiraceae bacterium]
MEQQEYHNWKRIHRIYEGMKNQEEVPLKDLARLVQAAEEEMSGRSGEWHNFGHVTEAYYYEYFFGGGDYEEAPLNMSGIWRLFGSRLEKQGQTKDAKEAFERALQWNPADCESLLALIEIYRKLEDLEMYRELTDESYDFCNTRALLARYYRNLGYYHLENYRPELAEALYLYSELFYPTEHARRELSFLREVLKRETPAYTKERLCEILAEYEIPLEASRETLALTLQAAKDCEKSGRYTEAGECYRMIYDLTGDPEIWETLKSLEEEEE